MPLDEAHRNVLPELLLVSGLTLVGFLVSGQSVLAMTLKLATGIGNNWAASLAERGFGQWRNSWLTEGGALQDDIRLALLQAFQDAVAQLERDWQHDPRYAYLKQQDKDAAQNTLNVLKFIRNDAKSILGGTATLGRAIQQQTQLPQDAVDARHLMDDALRQYLFGHDEQFRDFIQKHLPDEWIIRFNDILKESSAQGTRAWRAVQQLQQASLQSGVDQLQEDAVEVRTTLQWLREWAERLERLTPSQRDDTGLSSLEAILVLGDVSTGVGRIEASLASIIDRLPLQLPVKQNRDSLLTRIRLDSRARCIERWTGAGVPRDVAVELAEDATVGMPHKDVFSKPDKRLVALVAELGAGKSLIAERLLQVAIAVAADNPNAPIPVYLEAADVTGPLQAAVETAAVGLGEPRAGGVMVVLDDVDVVGNSRAARLLLEARRLVEAWPSTTVIVTSRLLPAISVAQEVVPIPPLPEETAVRLIGMLLGRAIDRITVHSWPPAVRDAVRRPLFAVAMSSYLREGNIMVPRSRGQLLSSLVDRALQRAQVDPSTISRQLERLAKLSTDRAGGLIPKSEVVDDVDVQQLLNSGLVVERNDALGFPLPILTQWFAARSVASGSPSPEDLVTEPERLESWRYPIVIMTARHSHEQVSRVLTPLAERQPAFAAEVVMDALNDPGLSEEVPAPPALECGRRIRTSMEAWVRGLGPIAHLAAPLRPAGTVRSIGVTAMGAHLTTSFALRSQHEVAESSFQEASLAWSTQASMVSSSLSKAERSVCSPGGAADERWARPGRRMRA